MITSDYRAPSVLQSKALYPWRNKIVTLAEELRRRYRNMGRYHSKEDTLNVVRPFLTKMATSVYNKAASWEIVKSATVNFFREVAEVETGRRPLYRSREDMAKARVFKAMKATNWFKARRGGRDVREQKDMPTVLKRGQVLPTEGRGIKEDGA